VRFAARMIVIACLAAAVLVPAAAAADRMWVGFQDDPMFRWDPQRMEAMDQARGNNARIVRTVVDWSRAAADRPANPTNSFDPAYNFGDVDELVRNAQQRGMEVLITLWGTPNHLDAHLREAREGGLHGSEEGERDRAGRDRRDVVARP